MTVKESLVKELDRLNETQLVEVEKFVLFLRFSSHIIPYKKFDDEQMAKLYGEFAEEDSLLAEEGLKDYTNMLLKEDKQ